MKSIHFSAILMLLIFFTSGNEVVAQSGAICTFTWGLTKTCTFDACNKICIAREAQLFIKGKCQKGNDCLCTFHCPPM